MITYPNFYIRTLKTRFSVDTVDISDFAVHYSELNKEPNKTGTLNFTATKARLLNVSNDTKMLGRHTFCTGKLTILFMGRSKLNLSFAFNLVGEAYNYSYSGHLAPMSMNAVNPVLMPLTLVKIKSGELRSLEFAIAGDKKESTGTLHFLYNDLAVDLLNRNYHPKVLKTFLANIFVVKHDNPGNDAEQPRFAKVVYFRPKSYPFFEAVWETLLSGIKPCVGVGHAVQPEPSKPLSKKEQKAIKKALRKAKKAKKKADRQFQKALKKQRK